MDYKKEQRRRNALSVPKAKFLKPVSSRKKAVASDGEYVMPYRVYNEHYENGVKITLPRRDRRALKYARDMHKYISQMLRIKKQWWLHYV